MNKDEVFKNTDDSNQNMMQSEQMTSLNSANDSNASANSYSSNSDLDDKFMNESMPELSDGFIKEYRDMVTEELPDLWSRIEAALPEKNVTPNVTATNVVSQNVEINIDTTNATAMDTTKNADVVNATSQNAEINIDATDATAVDTAENVAVVNATSQNVVSISDARNMAEQKKKKRKSIYQYSAIIAACICGLVIIPIILMSRNGKMMNNAPANDAMMLDSAADCAVAEESADAWYDDADAAESFDGGIMTNQIAGASKNESDANMPEEEYVANADDYFEMNETAYEEDCAVDAEDAPMTENAGDNAPEDTREESIREKNTVIDQELICYDVAVKILGDAVKADDGQMWEAEILEDAVLYDEFGNEVKCTEGSYVVLYTGSSYFWTEDISVDAISLEPGMETRLILYPMDTKAMAPDNCLLTEYYVLDFCK